MNSRELVRATMERKQTDKVPALFEATESVIGKLLDHYKIKGETYLLDHFKTDIQAIDPDLIFETQRSSMNHKNYSVNGLFGEIIEYKWDGKEYNNHVIIHPLDTIDTIEELSKFKWPDPAQVCDFESLSGKLETAGNRAVITGHWGPFQCATRLRSEEKLYMDLALNPEYTKKIFARLHEFEMEYYTKVLEAGEGKIDILRPHDDYGTQISLLFSETMWKEYFMEHTKALVDLAHKYGAFYQQHSCGAIEPIIKYLIECGVDALEPIQPVTGMEPEKLKREYGKDITFVGGIDTQHLLPFGSKDEIYKEVRYYIETLSKDGGYVLYPSQAWESIIPLETIEYFYEIERTI